MGNPLLSQLGPYELAAPIGAGGMGEVFRARDTRLHRDVAVKVLPKDFVADPDRLRRFEQEATTLAALNHPNILMIHDTGVQEGRPYVVSELLQGQTLREVLGSTKGSGIPVRKAIHYALQIVQGMAAAHSKGIIHRDLKPENIFITKDGRIKILDFGLAKLQSDLKSEISNFKSPADDAAPTLLQTTQPGMVLGTPAYMSPEQVRGGPADQRSDIFAFGGVLYEMLSGTRAFRRDTSIETMNAVLKEEPPELSVINPTISPVLERVVLRCLEKQAEHRFQSARDLAFALENIGTASTSVSKADFAKPTMSRPGFTRLLPWAIAAVFLAGFLFTIILHKNAPQAAADAGQAKVLRKFDVILPRPSHEPLSLEPYLAISPDGKEFAYGNADGLWMKRLDSTASAVLLASGDHILAPFWSPEGNQVGYFEGRNLYRIPSTGGSPRLIGAAPEDMSGNLPGAAWLGDRIIFTTGESGLLEIPALGGSAVTLLPKGQGEQDFHEASALPDGRGVLFLVHRTATAVADTIAVWSPQGQRRVLLQIPRASFTAPVFSSTGHILFCRQDQSRGLWAFGFSLEALERTTEPFRVSDVGMAPSVAKDGTLLFSLIGSELYARRQLTWVDRSGKILSTLGPPTPGLRSPSLSPDGQRVVCSAGGSRSELDLWLFDVAGGGPIPLTRNGGPDNNPHWWNDGRTIVFTRATGSGLVVMAKPADGSAPEQRLIEGLGTCLSRSGKYLFVLQGPQDKATYGYVPLGREPLKVVALPPTFQAIRRVALSPDDRFLAYESVETDTTEVYLVDFPGFTNRHLVSRRGGHHLKWNPNGTELFYLSGDGRALMSAKLKPDGRGTYEATKVFELPESIHSWGDAAWPGLYDVSPDGERFVMMQKLQESAAALATKRCVRVVLNWFEEFRDKR